MANFCAPQPELPAGTPRRRVTIVGATACTQLKIPVRFTATIRSHSSFDGALKAPRLTTPALLTRMSIAPRSRMIASIVASTALRSVTSIVVPRALPPIAVAEATAPSSLISTTCTSAPCSAIRAAICAPIPRAPPVTSAMRPLKSGCTSSSRTEPAWALS